MSQENGIYTNASGKRFRLCDNYINYNVCNACIEEASNECMCLACSMNTTVPNLNQSDNLNLWRTLEKAKRRLVRTLLSKNLPFKTHIDLKFSFIEDQSRNPYVDNQFVYTGHADGMITVNLNEADDIEREKMRIAMGEAYRTPLGHLRHESGHYYFDVLVAGTHWITEFRNLFGDERLDYKSSLEEYYQQGKYQQHDPRYISHYAKSHPVEDWAETWAHYLHMVDTLETAHSHDALTDEDFDLLGNTVADWEKLTIMMNELNRSLGLSDAYPFVLSNDVIKKLNFVHQVIDPIN